MTVIKVVFLPKRSAPKNLKLKVFYVETDNHTIAEESARKALDEYLDVLSEKFRITKDNLACYFDKVAMDEIKVIKPMGE